MLMRYVIMIVPAISADLEVLIVVLGVFLGGIAIIGFPASKIALVDYYAVAEIAPVNARKACVVHNVITKILVQADTNVIQVIVYVNLHHQQPQQQ